MDEYPHPLIPVRKNPAIVVHTRGTPLAPPPSTLRWGTTGMYNLKISKHEHN